MVKAFKSTLTVNVASSVGPLSHLFNVAHFNIVCNIKKLGERAWGKATAGALLKALRDKGWGRKQPHVFFGIWAEYCKFCSVQVHVHVWCNFHTTI